MGLFSDLFGGAADFASAAGYQAESRAYTKAAGFAKQNSVIAGEAGRIKLEQTNRAIFQTLGQQQAAYGGAGLRQSGSAIDVYRNSVSQGALERAIVQEQTQINVTGYLEQESAFNGMASQASAAAAAAAAQGVGSILDGIFGIVSGGAGAGGGAPGIGAGG